MSITTILIVITVFSALSIIVLALMQTSKGDMGSAFGGGGSQSMFGARGSANFLSRTTAVMVTVFFLSSIALAYFYANRDDARSVVEGSVLETTQTASEVPSVEDSSADELPVLETETGQLPALEAPVDAVEEAQSEVPTLEAGEDPATQN